MLQNAFFRVTSWNIKSVWTQSIYTVFMPILNLLLLHLPISIDSRGSLVKTSSRKRFFNIAPDVHIKNSSNSEGSGGLPLPFPGGGLWRRSRTLHRVQLPHGC